MKVGRLLKSWQQKVGLPPGEAVYLGPLKVEHVRVIVHQYNGDQFHQYEVEDISSIQDRPDCVTWIRVIGLHDVPLLKQISDHFNMQAMCLEDVVNVDQRPKLDMVDDYVFVVMKNLMWDVESSQLRREQISFYVQQQMVISFEETDTPVFNPLFVRFQNAKGKLRNRSAEYLLYAIWDIIVDHYFLVMEHLARRIELLDENLFQDFSINKLTVFHQLKREVILARYQVWPLEEMLRSMTHGEVQIKDASLKVFFEDVRDHVRQLVDTVDTFNDILDGLLNTHLSIIGHRTNEMMRVLAIVGAVFMPLTVIAGIYGMNFQWMPELAYKYAYPLVLSFMGLVVLALLAAFRFKKWL